MTPTRILHVLTAMDLAGTETLLMNLYRNIDRAKVQFDFAVSAVDECKYDKEILSLGGKLYHYPRYRGYNHFGYCKWWNDFFSEHAEHRIVHGHIGSTAAIYLRIAKKYGRFAIAHSHSTTPAKTLHSRLYSLYSYRTRFIADFFWGCSRQALIDRYGEKIANSNRSAVLKNGIDVKKFKFDPVARKKIRYEYNISPDTLLVGTVGRLTPQKNPFFVVDIIKELKKKNFDFKFLWIGTGELKDEINKLVKENGLDDCVIMAGVRKDVNLVLQGMDVFIFPSIWEGLGISCVEAQAAGLPTLCSNRIPDEACATNLFEKIPIDNVTPWIDKIVGNVGKERAITSDWVKAAGYDIVEISQTVQLFYLRHI